jgi:alkylation response protein AidB-like acyl-CoA dehydrogenase
MMDKNTRCMKEVFINNENIRIKKIFPDGNHGSENNEYYFGNVLGAEHLGEFKPAGEFGFVKFQNGTVPENGVNGICIEDLIEVCIDKLQMFQSTNLSCRQNALAMTKLEEALHWLQARTADRRRRWVEGTPEE